MTQAFRVYQSLWAMERRRPDGAEWTVDEKRRMIIDAGFDGVGVRFIDPVPTTSICSPMCAPTTSSRVSRS